MSETQAEVILERHIQAIGNDLDAFLANVDDNAVFISHKGTFYGKEPITTMIKELFDTTPSEIFKKVRIVRREKRDGIMYVTYTVDPALSGTLDTIIIRNGKVVAQTFFWHTGRGKALA